MSRISHTDAPDMTDAGRRLYEAVWTRRPARETLRLLLDDFGAAARMIDTPGYIQPGGFWTFKLAGVGGDNLVRLHVWPRGLPDQIEAAGTHDHVFDFTSLILAGERPMINTRYIPVADSRGDLSMYGVNYIDPKNTRIERIGDKFRTAVAGVDRVNAGEYYTLKAGDFHTSAFEDNAPGMTLMVTRIDPAVTRPRFLSAMPETAGFDYTRQPVSIERRHIAAAMLNGLRAQIS